MFGLLIYVFSKEINEGCYIFSIFNIFLYVSYDSFIYERSVKSKLFFVFFIFVMDCLIMRYFI